MLPPKEATLITKDLFYHNTNLSKYSFINKVGDPAFAMKIFPI